MTETTDAPDFLSLDEVLDLHAEQLALFGGSPGIRDHRALESAVATPQSTFDGHFLHEDVFHMAAAYAYHIAEAQAFVDGNKRTALNAALVFLDINGWTVTDPEMQLYEAMSAFAMHTLDKEGMAQLFRQFACPLDNP